jgi:O-acetylserine/cysteine efflux transporter
MKPFHAALILCATVIWGFNFVATRVVLEVFSAEQMAFARAVITLVILLPWWKPFQGIPIRLVFAGLSIGTVSYFLLYQAINITESLTTVAVGTQLMPPFSAILALLFFHERVSPRKWAGILIAFVGAAYLAGVTESRLSLTALGLTVFSVFAYAAGSVVIGKTTSGNVWRMLAWISALSVLPLGVLAAFSGPLVPDLASIHSEHWLSLFFAVVFAALLAQAVLFVLYHRYTVSDVAPWVLLVPLFAGLSAVLVYREPITFGLILGGLLVIFGVWYQQSGEREPPGGGPGL